MSQIFKCIILLCLCTYSFCKSPDPFETLYILESKNPKLIRNYFDSMESLSVEEAQIFLKDFSEIVFSNFSKSITPLEIREGIFSFFQSKDCPEINTIMKTITLLLEDPQLTFLKKTSIFEEKNNQQSMKIVNCKNKKDEKNPDNEGVEIPGNVIFGGIEVICGALLWITPFKTVGSGMMIDGVRRMLNTAEEKNENRQNSIQNRTHSL